MSRASYIYIAFDSFNDIQGTFTVKHELISFLRLKDSVTGWRVWRFRDGLRTQPAVKLDIEDLLA